MIPFLLSFDYLSLLHENCPTVVQLSLMTILSSELLFFVVVIVLTRDVAQLSTHCCNCHRVCHGVCVVVFVIVLIVFF
jgi:hypothetical protein